MRRRGKKTTVVVKGVITDLTTNIRSWSLNLSTAQENANGVKCEKYLSPDRFWTLIMGRDGQCAISKLNGR